MNLEDCSQQSSINTFAGIVLILLIFANNSTTICHWAFIVPYIWIHYDYVRFFYLWVCVYSFIKNKNDEFVKLSQKLVFFSFIINL